MAKTYLLPKIAALEDVASIRLEVVNVTGANASKLDVDFLGCSKGKNNLKK